MGLSYLDQAVEKLNCALVNEEHITVYSDYDTDGLTSSLQWKTLFKLLGHEDYTVVPYTKRTHSIDPNLPSVLLQHKSGLCIISDTGCSEPEMLKYLNSISPIIVLDHHKGILQREIISDTLVVVNPAMWNDGVTMSAACVVFEVIMAWVEKYRLDDLEYFQRMLSFYPFVSIYADGAYGPTDYVYNLYQLAQDAIYPPEFSFAQEYFNTSKRFVLFSVAPPINAAFRNNRLDLINELFLNHDRLLSYEKSDLVDELKVLRNDMRKHIDNLEKIVEPIEVGEFNLVDLTGYLNQGISNEIIWNNKGLIANKIAGKYKKACICIVNTGDRYTLSVRDFYGRDILSLMQTIYEVGSHPSAFGGSMSAHDVLYLKKNLERLSTRLPAPKPKPVLNFAELKEDEVKHIAFLNEFLHPNAAKLIYASKTGAKLEPTPAKWGPVYNQYQLKLPSGTIIYIKQEAFDDEENPRILIQLYKGKRIGGSMVEPLS